MPTANAQDFCANSHRSYPNVAHFCCTRLYNFSKMTGTDAGRQRVMTEIDWGKKPNVREKAKEKAKTVTHSTFSPFNYLIRSISHLINVRSRIGVAVGKHVELQQTPIACDEYKKKKQQTLLAEDEMKRSGRASVLALVRYVFSIRRLSFSLTVGNLKIPMCLHFDCLLVHVWGFGVVWVRATVWSIFFVQSFNYLMSVMVFFSVCVYCSRVRFGCLTVRAKGSMGFSSFGLVLPILCYFSSMCVCV